MDCAIPLTDGIYGKNIIYNIYYKNFLYVSSIGYFTTVKLLNC